MKHYVALAGFSHGPTSIAANRGDLIGPTDADLPESVAKPLEVKTKEVDGEDVVQGYFDADGKKVFEADRMPVKAKPEPENKQKPPADNKGK